MKKVFTLLAVLIMTAVTSAWAQVESGDFGTNLHWAYYSDTKTLAITNNTTTPEAMPDYSDDNSQPWYSTCGTTVTSVTIGDNITAVGKNDFNTYNTLTSVSLSNSVTSIGTTAFAGCSALESVSLPKVTTIGQSAFASCSALTSVSLPEVTTIDYAAFSGCSKLATIDMPKVTSVGTGAFASYQKLTSISMPEVTSLGTNVFAGCASLKSVSMAKLTAIPTCSGFNYFCCETIETVDIPSVTSIGNYGFARMSGLKTINMPKVETIGSYVFVMCSNLTSISLPKVKTIADNAFAGFTALKTVELGACPTLGGSSVFYGVTLTSATINLTDGSFVGTSTANYPTLTANPTYTRQLADGQTMGTLVLPFAITNNSDDYTLGYVSEASVYGITVTDYDKDEEIAAGTPILFKAKTAGAKLTFTASSTSLNLTREFTNSSKVANWTMNGTYDAVYEGNASSGDKQVYYIGTDDTFYYANQDFPCNTFRGWLETNEQRPSSGAKASLTITWDDDVTGVKDVNANADANRSGKYIEKGRVVIVNNNKKFNINGQELK